MRRRVRWENVLRVVAAALLVAVVVAWPRLAPPEPGLPGPEAAPLEGERRELVPMGGDGRSAADDARALRRRVAREGRRRRAAGRERARGRRRREGRERDDRRARREVRGRERERDDRRARAGEGVAGGDEAAGRDDVAGSDEGVARTDEQAPAAVGEDRAADPAQAEFGFERGG